ncbi:outer membrane usher protein [Escherichia coli]|nr:outer membrane usher protein [Escherichia coli]
MPDHSLFRLRILPWCIALAMSGSYSSVWAEDDIQFDSRFLELKGDTKIDLKRFSSQGYVEPGKYNLQVQLNKQPLAEEYDIYWYAGEDDVSKSYACLTPELVAQFGLKEDVAKNLQWSHDGKCLKPGQLEGMEIKADLSQSALVISLPQAYLEYTWPDWDPPSRWDDGISGIIADYSITAQTRHEENGGDDSNEISGNGTVGVNLGPWRMRADWQTNYQHTRSNDDDEEFSGDDTQKNGSGVAIMPGGRYRH